MNRRWLAVCCILVASCTAPSEGNDCEPDQFVAEPSIHGEAKARTSDDFEVWSLWFVTDSAPKPGEPIHHPADKEIKIVWSATGDGDFTVTMSHSDGTVVAPFFGPNEQGGSNWEVPGDEWGTGFIFPKEGCWDFTVNRGSDTAHLTVLAEA